MNTYQKVTQQILDCMKQGVLPWRRPWGGEKAIHFVVPANAKTRRPYGGINTMLLLMAEEASPYWGTQLCWETMGGTIKQDARPTDIVAFFRDYPVYNLSQVDGCEIPETLANLSVDRMIENSGVRLNLSGDKACYQTHSDLVSVPPRESFHSDEAYYTTLLHEMIHWTGGRLRLNRFFGEHGSKDYAFEELIAELGSCFVAAQFRIPLVETPNHASYLSYWLSILGEDESAIFRAAAKAQVATNFLVRLANRKGAACFSKRAS